MDNIIFIVPQIELRHKELLDPSRKILRIEGEDAYFPYTVIHRKDNDSLALNAFISELSTVVEKERERRDQEDALRGRWLHGELD